MLASIWPMHDPRHTAPTTTHRYEGRRSMARAGGGSRPSRTAARTAAMEKGPGRVSVSAGFRRFAKGPLLRQNPAEPAERVSVSDAVTSCPRNAAELGYQSRARADPPDG